MRKKFTKVIKYLNLNLYGLIFNVFSPAFRGQINNWLIIVLYTINISTTSVVSQLLEISIVSCRQSAQTHHANCIYTLSICFSSICLISWIQIVMHYNLKVATSLWEWCTVEYVCVSQIYTYSRYWISVNNLVRVMESSLDKGDKCRFCPPLWTIYIINWRLGDSLTLVLY
jgi:hypothetical protein